MDLVTQLELQRRVEERGETRAGSYTEMDDEHLLPVQTQEGGSFETWFLSLRLSDCRFWVLVSFYSSFYSFSFVAPLRTL